MRQGIANFLSLFTTTGTLLCCALPSLLVAVGAGAVVASVVSAAPWLAWLSRYKEWLFLFAGLMIALNIVLVYRPRSQVACAVGAGKACEDASRLNKFVLWLSAGIYLVGLFMESIAMSTVVQSVDVEGNAAAEEQGALVRWLPRFLARFGRPHLLHQTGAGTGLFAG